MSSRNTFVTNYLYDADAANAIAEVLQPYTHVIHNHGMYVAGFMKNAFWDYPDIFARCKAALETIEYPPTLLAHFEIVLIGDDERGVAHSGDWCTF